MKRIISLLLVLVLCVALPVSVAAAEMSPGPEPPIKTGDTAPVDRWITIMVISLVLLVVVAFAFRKTFKKN